MAKTKVLKNPAMQCTAYSPVGTIYQAPNCGNCSLWMNCQKRKGKAS